MRLRRKMRRMRALGKTFFGTLALTFVLSVFSGENTAHGKFIFFNDPRFLSDPYEPFFDYEDKEDLAADLEEIEHSRGAFVKDPQLDAMAQALIDEVYSGFKQLYPKLMSNKAKPRIIIIDNDDPTNIAAYGSRLVAPHGMVTMSSGFLKSNKTKASKLGLAAHETAHLLLHHATIDHRDIIRFGYASGKALSLTEMQAAEKWLFLAQFLGLFRPSQMNGLTFDPQLGDGFRGFIMSLYAEKSQTECGKDLRDAGLSYKKMAKTSFSILDDDYVFASQETLTAISHASLNAIKHIKSCLRVIDTSKNSIPIGYTGMQSLIHAGVADRAVTLDRTTITFQEYVRITKQALARMDQLAAQFNVSELRTYTIEDQADTLGLSVIVNLKSSPQDYLETFLDEIPSVRARCLELVKSGTQPPFGNLADTHHSFCWRYYSGLQVLKSTQIKLDGLE